MLHFFFFILYRLFCLIIDTYNTYVLFCMNIYHMSYMEYYPYIRHACWYKLSSLSCFILLFEYAFFFHTLFSVPVQSAILQFVYGLWSLMSKIISYLTIHRVIETGQFLKRLTIKHNSQLNYLNIKVVKQWH